ncbi:hypothetical protein BDZ91DRAFT_743290, partial [Kalaharituber pfeilii]
MRARHDTKRIPIFAILFIVCGEFTPLIVVAFSSIVPFPCRIPRQIYSDNLKLEKSRSDSFSTLPPAPITTTNFANITTANPNPKLCINIPPVLDLSHLTPQQLSHIATTLGLKPALLKYIPGLLRRRVQKRIEYLELDDLLIEYFGGLDTLASHGGKQELEWAAIERGIDTLKKKPHRPPPRPGGLVRGKEESGEDRARDVFPEEI